ncbi:Ig-like domain-containing protein [Microbacterium sp. SLBN-146]|uniref:Ig-like domain-containing protein n=1 Tax=Microbacterium sp. SLBN-146 TaxID=2768457 RepID=UPI00114DFAA5|nr:Ig-like domain-containing protein [Microbacterium sp. SLBN-146]TQJ30561.1 fibronectin type III domain protein [Microbacterium sp. SLBN-146]
MTSFAWLRARPKALASASVLTASAVAIATMAFVYEGFPTTEVDLHDGGVWVTKQSALMVGHFNHESRVLDGALRTTSDDYDIIQSGETVLLHDRTDASLTAVDPAMVVLTDAATTPVDADVQLGGETVALLDRESGDVWVVPAQAASSFQVQGTDPTASLGPGAAIAVGVDGTTYGVSPSTSELVTIRAGDDGEAAEPTVSTLPGVDESSEVSVSAVGSTAVVLDAASGRVLSSAGLSAEVEQGQTGVLQVPSVESDAVLVATSGSLVRVPLDGSEPVGVSSGAQGDPAAPVRLNGCSYAAWSGSAKFVRDCVGEADDLSADIEGVTPESVLRFRVNRDVVVLNDIVGGAAWMASDSLQRIDNWNDVTPPEGETEEDEQTTEESVETTLPERTEQNTAPIANDDDFGVRPGRTTVLPVLDNDSDADGDVLTVTLPNGDPGLGTVQPINNGAGLQIAVPEDATGSDSFLYEVNDGRGGTDTATTRLTVHGWDVNSAPVQKRVTAVTVESGGTVSYNVLPDWIDPDGDDVFLASVVPAPGDEADFTSDGRITYRAIGGTQGRKDVVVLVSDGNEVTEGIVRFDVRPVGSTVPVTNADHVVVRAGQTVTVSPLANDTSSGREPLRLTRVDEVAGATIVPDFANKTFSFTSDAPGTYYVQYLASAGANGVPGLVRVDVLADSDTDRDPIAVRDVALLPSGGDVLVNVLANDSDPAGGILVVQSVTVEPNSGIAVSVLNHETLRITDQAALGEQVRITYRISNGARQAAGEVVVIPVPAPSQLRPPVANDDQVIVRAGDIVTIPVLDNDYHPNGDTIHVAPDLVPPLLDPAKGEVFVSEDTLRFKAGSEPGTAYATYEVFDSAGQKDAGYVTIQILPVNEETNTAPRPRDLTARVLNGSKVKIAIPLDGIDPDGDSVELVGVASAPKKGRITETGSNFLVYESFDESAGLDSFTYRVRDRLGLEATAPIRVGIAPPEAVNQAPYAVKDSVIMRPGRSVAVPVTANDSDPDGDEFGLVRDGLILPDVPGLEAVVQGQRVVVTSPDEPVETSLQYTIRDARGAEAKAVLQITVADDVPLQRPIARDDRVQPADIEDDQVDVEVLANDEDPDGTKDALTVSVAGDTARVLDDGTVRVTLSDERQLLTYTITDQDGLAASAFIVVPGLGSLPPTITGTGAIEVKSGETIEIPLAEYVRAGAGKSVVVTEAQKVQASFSNGANLVKDQRTLVYTSAAGYFGPDALTFEVTDGTGPDDPAGIKATLSLAITVLPPDNQQPSFTSGQVDVAPGEDPATLDLRALTTDPDPGDLERLQFQLVGSAPQGISASIDGGALRASAGAGTPKGTTATLTVRVTDGETEPVEGTVTVRVTASTRPLPTANDDTIAEAPQGRAVTVPVLANDFNPFPETPLTVTTAIVETGQGTAAVAGDQVRVTPDANFFGTMVVRYRVQDATGDADREVEGRIRLTVQGRPDAPGTPTVSSVQDRTVVLSWSPPPNNGAEITGYTVRSLAGNYTKACVATTCTLDGLTNNVEYNFVVVATNRVGDSEASAPSETARPDARPDTPNPPTLQFGDRSLQVAWVTPSTPGSPVESFTLEISPAPPSGITQKTNVTGNSLTWEGLENGTNYQVRVRAHNRAPDPSSWSAYSAGMVPAAPPSAAAAPTTTRLQPVGTQAQMQVNWTPPAANGDAISGYRLNVIRGGSLVRTVPVPAGQTSQALSIDASTSDYTFTVAAQNKAGWGADSAPSAPRRAFTPPGAPTNVQATTPANDSRIVVTYGEAPGNGANPSELRYEYNVGGGWRGDWDGRTIVSGIANNNTYTVQVRAYTQLDGVRYDGAASSASNSAAPYGPIGQPGASASASGTNITFNWSAPARNGRDIVKMEIAIDGVTGWKTVAASGSETHDVGYSQSRAIQVRATDAAGQVSTNSASARSADPPQPRAWPSKGSSAVGQYRCSDPSCAYAVLNVSNFPAGDYTLSCNGTGPWGGQWGASVYSVPANGSIQLNCYFGDPGEEFWILIHGRGESERIRWY